MDLKRKYSNEEKRQLVANLDIEVAHRTRQLEAWLKDKLETFTMQQEGQISRIPKQVRAMTLREFGKKYEGNVQSALRGYQKERMAAAGGDATLGEIDKSMRKRKWIAPSPKKLVGSSSPGTAKRSRLLPPTVTPSTIRTMGRLPPSSSPQKSKPPFGSSGTYNPRPMSRPTSPLKYQSSVPNLSGPHPSRVPSSSSFNPTLPSKTLPFPSRTDQTAMRLPRRDENMLSVNGSPLANPYEFGLGWFTGIEMSSEDDPQDGHGTQKTELGDRTLKRTKSGIIVRRDPSVAFPATMNGYHSRTDSQASFYTATSQATSSSSSHSRENSCVSYSQPNFSGFRFPAPPTTNNQATPRPALPHIRSFSALVAIPTKDGHLLEFDPLQTSPGALNALEGITDSAKKQARAEMGKLVQAAVDKWKVLPS